MASGGWVGGLLYGTTRLVTRLKLFPHFQQEGQRMVRLGGEKVQQNTQEKVMDRCLETLGNRDRSEGECTRGTAMQRNRSVISFLLKSESLKKPTAYLLLV